MLDRMDEVWGRIRKAPIEHLSCHSLDALTAYEVGYVFACGRWGIPTPLRPHGDEVLEWLRSRIEVTDEHAGRLNAFNWLNVAPFARLVAADDREAFDVYLELYDQIPAPLTRHSWGQRQSDESLVDILRRIQERPAIYFGNGFRFLQVWAFCSGFRWAERDASVQASLSEPLFAGFSKWLEARYPFSRGIPWHRLFHALALGNASSAFTSFMEHFGL